MEIKAKLKKPYSEKQKLDFIVQQNHKFGYEIKETNLALEAWGYTYEEKEAQEKERIAKLSCTKRDFALMLQEMGVDYFTTLKPLIESNPQAQLEWELCERLYRFNPMLDLMASQMGVTSEQLDGLFKYANGEITLEEFRALKPVEEPTETPVEEPSEEPTEDIPSENV